MDTNDMNELAVSQFNETDINETKSVAWLSYMGILFLVPMLMYKSSPYVKFHVNQGLVLFISCIIFSCGAYVLLMIAALLMLIPNIGTIMFICVVFAVSLAGIALFVFSIMGIVNALTGKASRLPIIGRFTVYK